jgi:ribonuclease HII
VASRGTRLLCLLAVSSLLSDSSMKWPNLDFEQKLWASGQRHVAGLDEVGRGAWAGPVVAAAVILPHDRDDLTDALAGVRDSKLLSPRQRKDQLPVIRETCVASGIGMASARFIDRWGIVPATQQAMLMALQNLSIPPQYLLVDALHLPHVGTPQRALPKGDLQVLSIAAASILAKVFRDRLMIALDRYRPGYAFASHKGYGTPAHYALLTLLGPSPAHRMSFAPMCHMAWNGHSSR